MNRLPAPFCCFSRWFVLLWFLVFVTAIWLGVRIPKAPTPRENITLVFYTFARDGSPMEAYLIQVDSQKWIPVASGAGCQLTRPEGTTLELTFSRDQQLSADDTRVRVVWMKTEQFKKWLQQIFPKENGLSPFISRKIIDQMLRGTAGNKQYYPVVLPHGE